jgi:hypothetical protein
MLDDGRAGEDGRRNGRTGRCAELGDGRLEERVYEGGDLVALRLRAPDGASEERLYREGVLVRVTMIDPSGAEGWRSWTQILDGSGPAFTFTDADGAIRAEMTLSQTLIRGAGGGTTGGIAGWHMAERSGRPDEREDGTT